MNRIIASLVIAFAVTTSACALDNDTPTPTPVSVDIAGPNGTATPAPTMEKVNTPEAVGNLKIVDYDYEGYVSRNVIGGTDVWERFAGYMVCASKTDDANLTRVTVESGTDSGLLMDNADFAAVGIQLYGEVIGVGILPPGGTGKVSIPLSKPIWAPKDGACTPFRIVAKIANVSASSTVGGSWTGVCRSGHAPALGLAKDPSDPTKLDVSAVGSTGKKLEASSEFITRGQPMVIRKSQPIVTQQSLTSTILANGIEQDFFKVKIGSDSAGVISWKQFTLVYEKEHDLGFTNIRVRKGSTDLDPATYAFVYSDMIPSERPVGALTLQFKNGYEATESEAGSVYTFYGTTNGVKAGSFIKLSFSMTDSNVVTDALVMGFPYGDYSVGTAKGAFIWSDNSEVPHSADVYSLGGSRDWTNGFLIRDLGLAKQTLSK